jgi:hypothetical protein
VRDHILEEALRPEDVHFVARFGLAAEVADEGQMDDGRRMLGSEDVLELPLADVGLVDAEPRRVAFPVRAVDAD